jgi:hypothetical protein
MRVGERLVVGVVVMRGWGGGCGMAVAMITMITEVVE